MLKKKAEQAEKKYTYHPVDVNSGELEYSPDRSSSCCGVLEIGEFSTRKGQFSQMILNSKEVNVVERKYKDYDWQTRKYTVRKYKEETSMNTRPATYEEILKAFKHEQDKVWPKEYGLGVAYLLPVQQNSDWGRLLEDLGWTDLGRFWNPKTRHVLHHWVCTFRKGPPQKKTKSILAAMPRTSLQLDRSP